MTDVQGFRAAFSGTAAEFFETAAIAYAIIRAGCRREALAALLLDHAAVFLLALGLVPLSRVLSLFGMRLTAGLLLTVLGTLWLAEMYLERVGAWDGSSVARARWDVSLSLRRLPPAP